MIKLLNWVRFFIAVAPLCFFAFVATKILTAALGGVFVYYSGMLIDNVVEHTQGQGAQHPAITIGIMALVGVVLCASTYIGGIVSQQASDKIDYRLSQRFLDTVYQSDLLHARQEEYKNKNQMARQVMDNSGFWMVNEFANLFTAVVTIWVYGVLIGFPVAWVALGFLVPWPSPTQWPICAW